MTENLFGEICETHNQWSAFSGLFLALCFVCFFIFMRINFTAKFYVFKMLKRLESNILNGIEQTRQYFEGNSICNFCQETFPSGSGLDH